MDFLNRLVLLLALPLELLNLFLSALVIVQLVQHSFFASGILLGEVKQTIGHFLVLLRNEEDLVLVKVGRVIVVSHLCFEVFGVEHFAVVQVGRIEDLIEGDVHVQFVLGRFFIDEVALFAELLVALFFLQKAKRLRDVGLLLEELRAEVAGGLGWDVFEQGLASGCESILIMFH